MDTPCPAPSPQPPGFHSQPLLPASAPTPPALTGPQLPVHLQRGAGLAQALGGAGLAGVGEQVWPGLECDVDVEGDGVTGSHHLLGNFNVPAPPEGVGDGRVHLRVAGDDHAAALGEDLQDSVGDGDLQGECWKVNTGGGRKPTFISTGRKCWFGCASKSYTSNRHLTQQCRS